VLRYSLMLSHVTAGHHSQEFFVTEQVVLVKPGTAPLVPVLFSAVDALQIAAVCY